MKRPIGSNMQRKLDRMFDDKGDRRLEIGISEKADSKGQPTGHFKPFMRMNSITMMLSPAQARAMAAQFEGQDMPMAADICRDLNAAADEAERKSVRHHAGIH